MLTSAILMTLWHYAGLGNGEWSHVACRYDEVENNRACFWNGALMLSDKPDTKHATVAATFRIGSTHMGEFFNGEIDDVAIFNRSLSDLEIVQAMAGDYASAGGQGVCLTAIEHVSPPSPAPSPSPSPPPPAPPPVQVVPLSTDLNLAVGIVAETSMACVNNATAGFLVGTSGSSSTAGTAFVWSCSTQQFMIGGVTGTGSKFTPALTIDRKLSFDPAAAVELKVLLRTSGGGQGMVEFYVNGVMSHPYTMNAPPAGNTYGALSAVQTTAGDMAVNTKDAKAWRMTLAAV